MSFQTDFLICGIGPLGDQLVVLGYWKDAEKPQRPRMHVLEPRPGDYTDACTDNLSLRGYSEYSSNDYHLGKYFVRLCFKIEKGRELVCCIHRRLFRKPITILLRQL